MVTVLEKEVKCFRGIAGFAAAIRTIAPLKFATGYFLLPLFKHSTYNLLLTFAAPKK